MIRLFFILILTSSTTQAAPPAVKFFKSPSSPFASGELDQKILEKYRVSDVPEFSYSVQSAGKLSWVKGANIARDVQLGNYVYLPAKNRKYKVLQVQGSLLWGMPEGEGLLPEWLSMEDVNPVLDDLGVALTLKSVRLREDASWIALGSIMVPEFSRLEILEIKDPWVKVKFESVGALTGWVEMSSLIFKTDFASHVMTENKKWIPVLYRQGAQLISENNGQIPLNKVTAMMTKSDLGIAIKVDDNQGLLLKQNLKILGTRNQVWHLSKLTGHGEVYWQPQAQGMKPEDDILTSEQVMKREITSVSFHPKNQKMGILSSGGIYLTMDGEIWRKIPNFKTRNYPVFIDSQGVIFVGAERSLDQGKTFFPCLKWESFTHLVEAKQKAVPKDVRIVAISELKPGHLKYEIATDLGRMRWSARIANRVDHEFLTDWKFLGF